MASRLYTTRGRFRQLEEPLSYVIRTNGNETVFSWMVVFLILLLVVDLIMI